MKRYGIITGASLMVILGVVLATHAAQEPAAATIVNPPEIAASTAEPKPDLPAGHSYHGEAFNEGPRQQAYLLPGPRRANFKVTTKEEQAGKFFDQGIDQLHGFWYFEAERSFRQVVKFDADCAMAYWGMAMANINNADRAKLFIRQAVDRLGKASPREQMYIRASASR